jgi:LmbE family N-acetylglucosaminyl deacetylase
MPYRLLFIYAHPDDESFGVAGISRMYADRGAEIALVTATRGDAGRAGEPPLCERADLPARREAELHEAARLLGIGRCDRARLPRQAPRGCAGRQDSPRAGERDSPPSPTCRRQLSIQTAPIGIPTTSRSRGSPAMRFAAADDPRWYADTGKPHRVRRLVWISPVMPWDAPKSANLANEPGVDFLVDISRYRDVKAAALRAHRTQHVSIDRHFFHLPDLDRILSVETFRRHSDPRCGNGPRRIFSSR